MRSPLRSPGFTLVEIAVVIVVLGLLLTMLVGMSASLLSQQRIQTTRTRLANIDAALTLYVSQYKRLPCPADGTLASSNPASGVENAIAGTPRTCVANQQYGVVPWTALGLAAGDAVDGWGTRFTYRVGPDLVADNAMDFSSCDPAGGDTTVLTTAPYCTTAGTGTTQCNTANLSTHCTAPSTALTPDTPSGKGLVVENLAGTVVMDPAATPSTGAAYVVISHGAEGGGGYGPDGTLQSSSVTFGTGEAKNFANLAYTPPSGPGATPTSYLVDDVYNGPGTTHFDDLLSRPNVLTVAIRANMGPRSH